MNDYLIFGASGLTGNHFLNQVKKEGQKYHLFVRSLISNEQESNQDSKNDAWVAVVIILAVTAIAVLWVSNQ